jgi:RNA polymerase sigma factor (sigma-70 family)
VTATPIDSPIDFTAFYRAYRPMVIRFVAARVRSGDGHLVEDLAQETFLRAWRYLPGLQVDQPGAVEKWLCTIARHAVADLYRKGPGRQRTAETPADPRAAPVWWSDLVAVGDDTDRVCELLDAAAAWERASDETRRAVRLRLVDELPWVVIARSLRRGKPAIRRMVGEVIGS